MTEKENTQNSFWLKKTLIKVGQKHWSILRHTVINIQYDDVLISDESPYHLICVYVFI